MDCSKVQENLSAYLDGELEPGEVNALREHLESCQKCGAELESLRSTVKLIKTLPRAHAPAALKQRITAATGRSHGAPRFPRAMAVLTAAAIVLVSVVAVFMLGAPEPPPEEFTAAARRPKRALENETEKMAETLKEAPARVAKGDWSGGLEPEAEAPAPAPVAQKVIDKVYRDKEDLRNLAKKVKEARKETDGLPRHAKTPPAKLAKGFEYSDKMKQEETEESAASEKEVLRRHVQDFAKRLEEQADRKAELKEELAKETGKPAAPAGAPPAAEPAAPEAPEELAQAQEAVGKLRGAVDEDEEKAARKGGGGVRVEEIVLETRDVGWTAEAVGKLLAAHEGRKLTDERAVSKDQAGAKWGKEDADTVVLLVQVDTREYRELVEKLRTLEAQAALRDSGAFKENELGAPEEENGAKYGRGGRAQRELDKSKAEAEPKAARRARVPKAPSGGAARKKAAPGALGESFSEEKESAKKEKKALHPLEKPQERQKKAGAEQAEGEAPAPAGAPDSDAEAGKAGEELITLRIRIVKSELPVADLLRALEKRAAEREAAPKMAPARGK